MKTKLKVGQRILYGGNEWEILSFESETRLRLKVHAVEEKYFSRYLDVGSEYLAVRIPTNALEEVWEIPSEQMKRSVSQIILYIDGDSPPMIDMCS